MLPEQEDREDIGQFVLDGGDWTAAVSPLGQSTSYMLVPSSWNNMIYDIEGQPKGSTGTSI